MSRGFGKMRTCSFCNEKEVCYVQTDHKDFEKRHRDCYLAAKAKEQENQERYELSLLKGVGFTDNQAEMLRTMFVLKEGI